MVGEEGCCCVSACVQYSGWDRGLCFLTVRSWLSALTFGVLVWGTRSGDAGQRCGWVRGCKGTWCPTSVASPLLCAVQPAQTFMVRRGVHVSGASPESISSLLSEVAECGTHYARLSQFSLQPLLDSSCSKGLVLQVQA